MVAVLENIKPALTAPRAFSARFAECEVRRSANRTIAILVGRGPDWSSRRLRRAIRGLERAVVRYGLNGCATVE